MDKKSKTVLTILGVLILVLTAVGLAYYFIVFPNTKKDNKSSSIIDEPSSSDLGTYDINDEHFNLADLNLEGEELTSINIPVIYSDSHSYDETLFYNLASFNINNLSNKQKLLFVYLQNTNLATFKSQNNKNDNLNDYEYDYSYDHSIKNNDLKKAFTTTLGNIDYIPETFEEFNDCAQVIYYNQSGQQYNVYKPACGDDSDMITDTKMNIYKATTDEINNIYVYAYLTVYSEVFKNNENYNYKYFVGNKGYNTTTELDAGFQELINLKQVKTYKYTFTKQSDNKYYFVEGQWVN